ncbi:hypothetical protein KL953_09510 [Mycolicibacterium goodii]|uniref:Uncharacterized protein n=2 Tax=Mycolicibacterium goodii TaxID=134601 RepID=A0ABS6HX59_MYCGD|nr:hypothetical protein [Mycolicibacterium goodii]OKH74517.1 hypothetical protein EB74_08425 [Mycobacterium sp. SWH-M5]MBU8817063.1 hypothetical protein [Mycolicibacterium goodii]MBU8827264.1 hypothetical protein [Mycolicibacterium goodii]MBU8833668.1 hypothetical protein [Mycolicibacterium goodii]
MASDLRVDSGGLRAGAVSSEMIAAQLTLGHVGVGTDSPTHAGVSAMDAAVTAARARQSTRISAQAADMLAGALLFETADEDSAGGMAELM